jgi:hypothetical protein
MARIQTRDDLKNWILRKLGHPIVDQEITGDQLEDSIDDAIEEYIDGSGIGSTNRALLLHEVTSNEIILPDNVKTVVGVLNGNNITNSYNGNENIAWNGMCNNSIRYSSTSGSFDMVTKTIFDSYMGTMNPKERVLYELTINKQLHINPKPEIGSKLALDVVVELDFNDSAFAKHLWIRKYALALCKYQWGFSMMKFGEVVLESGVTVNYSSIMDEGRTEMDKQEEELEARYKFPAMFLVG